ncbi:MAG: energy-coupling factor transporter transmembrane protein EcfT [Bacillus sp. (in: Bacteria)]|nr:energy-coupling factor transporter transmembrane protein EcfT [Bacillus sp. (in: firmicutes)]
MRWELTYRETWLHQMNPAVKLLVMLFFFITVLFIHNPNVSFYIMVGCLLMFVLFTGYRWKHLLMFLLPFLVIFISTSTSMMFFGKGETTWWKWGLIHITEESFYRGLHLGFRALTFALLGLTFSLTTRPVYLFYSLMQQLKLKPKYAYSFLAGARLIPIMFLEFQTIRQALMVRGVMNEKGVKAFVERMNRYAIPLLSQSIRRAQRLAVAMQAKGFSEESERTYYYEMKINKHDVLFSFGMLVFTLLIYFMAVTFPWFPMTDVR